MAADFRKFEKLLEEFFRGEGATPCHTSGGLYVGACAAETELEHTDAPGHIRACVVIEAGATMQIVCLTDLAQFLARETQ